ncbi:methyltransferase domain-containing protein [Amycolatopsis sp. FBCC-B4732]|uniref:class I SAM-dependent methyltransferase n=1 Tax=Amycolatopsis sp. FBCC-B4732 TaxID=3079339 RepID=UPI001FF58810|nr:methyltransferase domain-containing protein [Amycolatopsis sp. FBCC-B4732]UOX89998.1 methyltransferase domain-containing protein [Amycolatopsis sp. FBCC-B4732]
MQDGDHRAKLLRALEYRRSFDARLERMDRETPFDRVHGVDTGTPVELWELPEADLMPIGRNARYAPAPVRTVRNVLASCGLVHEEVTFVDVGCGKGRVLLLAAEFPFRRIVGVEASETLCDIARDNVHTMSHVHGGYDRIEVVNADAAQFDVPGDAGFFFFYEPFSAEVSSTVLERIESSIRQCPRDVLLCFTGRGQPEDEDGEAQSRPVAAAAAEARAGWRAAGTVASPDAKFYDSFLFEYLG